MEDTIQVFLQYFLDNAELLQQIIEPEIYDAIAASITGATREEILAISSEKAAAMVTGITESTMKGLSEIITSGLDNQIGVDGLARKLKSQIGLNAEQVKAINNLEVKLIKEGKTAAEIQKILDSETKKKIKKRSEVIANTEMRKAVSEGEDTVMKSRGAKYKVAMSTGDSDVSDICAMNEAAGPIPIDDSFPSGDDTTPFHPDCRCSITYITSDEQLQRSQEKAEERANKTKEARNNT